MRSLLKIFIISAITVFISISPAYAETVKGKIITVQDGDSLTALINNNLVRVRLNCIDAPELTQPYGQESKVKLSKLKGVNAIFNIKTLDKYSRLVAEVFVGKKNHNVNLVMVMSGMAIANPEYFNECPNIASQLISYQNLAIKRKLGLWQQKNPVMPWDYRSSVDIRI